MADKKISALTAASTPLAGTEVLPIVQSGSTVKVSIADVTAGRSVSTKDLTATSGTSTPYLLARNTNAVSFATAELQLITANSFSGVSSCYIKNESQNGGNSNADLVFFVNSTGGGSPYESARLKGVGGDLQLATGNLVPSTAGKGIDFSANTGAAGMTSELLNWYEEGTWTPTLTPNTSGTITITSPTNSLNYTRVGRLVTLTGRITVSSVSAPLGLLILGGLPFSSGASGSKNSGAGAVYADNLTVASGLLARVAENATTAIIATPNQGAAAPIIQATTGLYINIAYTV